MTIIQEISQNLVAYGSGTVVTIELTLISLSLGLLIAIPLAIVRTAQNPLLRAPVATFTWFMRGTPLLAQLMIVYYGLGQFQWLQSQWQASNALLLWLRDPFYCALLALTLNTGAYTTEILAGALRATPDGEIEAAMAFGMSRSVAWRRILLPSALRRFLPAYGNEVVLLLHGTSMASAVTLIDLTGAARNFYANSYAPFEAFISAGVVYFALTSVIAAVLRFAERKYLAHLQPQRAVTLARV